MTRFRELLSLGHYRGRTLDRPVTPMDRLAAALSHRPIPHVVRAAHGESPTASSWHHLDALAIEHEPAWLGTRDDYALARDGFGVMTHTIERRLPELADYGYDPALEIEADLRTGAPVADITIEAPLIVGAVPWRLRLELRTSDSSYSADFSRYGLARIDGVRLTAASPNDFTFRISANRSR